MAKNQFEVTGNLTKDPIQNGENTFVAIAINSGKEKTYTDFFDIATFGELAKEVATFKKGDFVNFKGVLSNKKDKDTGYTQIGLKAFEAKKIKAKEDKDEK